MLGDDLVNQSIRFNALIGAGAEIGPRKRQAGVPASLIQVVKQVGGGNILAGWPAPTALSQGRTEPRGERG